MTPGDEATLIRYLLDQEGESEWFERKTTQLARSGTLEESRERLGKYISGLANSAALAGRNRAYLVFGIGDEGQVVGTKFDPDDLKAGNQDLPLWLAQRIEPRTSFDFKNFNLEGKRLVLLSIEAAQQDPVEFSGRAYIRIGSHLTDLREHRDRRRRLVDLLARRSFEDGIAHANLSDAQIVAMLDVTAYFDVQKLALPTSQSLIIKSLETDRMVVRDDDGTWQVTNLGAITMAKSLREFPSLARKAVRVIRYEGNDKTARAREWQSERGYVAGFEELIRYVMGQLPASEVIEIHRIDIPIYPEEALRELIPNALIHQDFSEAGSGPMIEIFANRLVISNPGAPRIPTDRFLDSPPVSPNEVLAGFMRRAAICEERGTGIDKVIASIELHQLPAPKFEVVAERATIATLFAPKPLREMTSEDRVRACYWHSVFQYVKGDGLTNTSLRKRLGLPDSQVSRASNIIREALNARRIHPLDPLVGARAMKYVPWWVEA